MNNKLKIAVGASIILMGIALLITQSIYAAAFEKAAGNYYDRAIVGAVFAAIGLAVAAAAGFYSFKNDGELNKVVLLALGVAFIFLFIGAVVPMDDQKTAGDAFRAVPAEFKDQLREADGKGYAAMQMFPASLTFLLAGSVVFLGSTAYGINKHEFDL